MSYGYDPFSQEEHEKESTAKKVANTAKNKVKRKIGKKVAKLAVQAIKKGLVVLGKAIVTFFSTLGLPLTLVIIGIVLLLLIIMLISSSVFGSGIELEGEELELYEHIVKESNSTVDMNNPEQAPYKVPVELLSSVVQIDAMQDDDHYQIVTDMAGILAPEFTYDEFNEWTETRSRTCIDSCGNWSSPSRTDNYVEKLTEIDYWQGNVKNTYEPYTTEWITTLSTRTITRTRTVTVDGEEKEESYSVTERTYTQTRQQKFDKEENFTEDYTFLDTALNSLGFGKNDKRILEINYTFQGLPMNYIAWLEGSIGDSEFFPGYMPYPGTIVPGSDIPSQFMPIYLDAEAKYGVPWYLLASVHAQETVFSTLNPMVSYAGAVGHMQFMPCTWVGWAYSGCKGTNGNANIPKNTKHNPASISKYGGYGVDANGDGKASPWDIEDAIHSAANMLAANGGASGDLRGAALSYNHAGWYADEVVARALRYQAEAVYTPHDNNSNAVIAAATSWLGKPNSYKWGGGRNQSDISRGYFDCSSFVHWAFAQTGMDLPNVANTSTQVLNKMGTKIPFSQIQPGDVIFFSNEGRKDGHVGIWLGNGQWIGSQTSTGIAIVDQNTNPYWRAAFEGHVRRY